MLIQTLRVLGHDLRSLNILDDSADAHDERYLVVAMAIGSDKNFM